ncbi:MAG: hypothetical protein D6770_03080 [Anaerolineae bacterium]|nr:MAG: hypothetical protein D6770_03080 [Anaerolineae bacterium]
MFLQKRVVLVVSAAMLLVSVACAAFGTQAPTATPYPTYTPYPEPTPYPTYTPLPSPGENGIPAGEDEGAFLQALVDAAVARGYDAEVRPLSGGGAYLRLVTPSSFIITAEYHYDIGAGINFLHFEASYGIKAGTPDLSARINEFNANYTFIQAYQREDTFTFVSTLAFGPSLDPDFFFDFVNTFEDAVNILSDNFSDVLE